MNENINLTEILKDCPKGTKLYSPLFGEVTLHQVLSEQFYSIKVETQTGGIVMFNKYGIYDTTYADADCVLFPSKTERDWSKFKCPKPKFDPKTLNHYDKVLGRDLLGKGSHWICTLFSHYDKGADFYPCYCAGAPFSMCIPYNDETKHLVGTNEEAPEFYRYWEDS